MKMRVPEEWMHSNKNNILMVFVSNFFQLIINNKHIFKKKTSRVKK